MKRLIIAMALAVAAVCSTAEAQYYGGTCSPGYCPPTYAKTYSHPSYRSVWSGWTFAPWAHDGTYFTRYRTWYDHCGTATNHNDGWLYTRDAYGSYCKHCLISSYAAKVPASPYIDAIGKTESGYHADEYNVVRAYPVLLTTGLIAPKNLPGTIDPRSVLAPPESLAKARQAFAENTQVSSTEMALKIAQGEQAKELEQIRGRNQLAREIQSQQNDERFLAEIKEFFAVRRQQSVIDASAATPRVALNVGNPKLGELISARCVSCHGPGKAEANLNFANVGPTDFKVWQKSFRKCATGEMPKNGEPLTDDELDLFDEQYQAALKSR